MVRTQVQLTDAQARRLRRLSRSEGVSVSELVRRFIEAGLADPGSLQHKYERAAALAGAFADTNGATDLSSDHDAYLDVAFTEP